MASEEEFLKAVKSGDLGTIQGMLAEAPDLKNTRTGKGVHAAVLAIYYGWKDIAAEIVRYGPEMTIHDAATLGDFPRVKHLVADDPDLVDAVSGDGLTPLALAALGGNLEILEYLMAQGASVNIVSENENRSTPLTGAVAKGNIDVVKVLLMHGADPNHVYGDGEFSPLLVAASHGKEGIVALLIQHGAYVNIRNKLGKTPLALAREKGYEAIAKSLTNAGATE